MEFHVIATNYSGLAWLIFSMTEIDIHTISVEYSLGQRDPDNTTDLL